MTGLLTPAEVAEICRVSGKTVMRAINAGELPASRLGRRGAHRIRPEDVEAWIAARAVYPSIPPVESATTLRSRSSRRRAGGTLAVHPDMGR
jgi:excisionase family DNA binding protein